MQQLTSVICQSHQRLLHLSLELLIHILRVFQITAPTLIDREVAHAHLKHASKSHWMRTSCKKRQILGSSLKGVKRMFMT